MESKKIGPKQVGKLKSAQFRGKTINRKPQPAWRLNVNKRSTRLTDEDNNQVFAMIGPNCQSMCTAVAQMHTSDAPTQLTWVYRHHGVLCFVRDIAKHSFFMRLYCLRSGELLWEQERCDTMSFRKSTNWLLIFHEHSKQVAFDFADESEAGWFFKIAVLVNRNIKNVQLAKKNISSLVPGGLSTGSAPKVLTTLIRTANEDSSQRTIKVVNCPVSVHIWYKR